MLAQASMQRSHSEGALDKAGLVSKFFEQPQHYSELSCLLFLREACPGGMQEKDREREQERDREREKEGEREEGKEGKRRGKGRGKEAGKKESAGGNKRERGRNALATIPTTHFKS